MLGLVRSVDACAALRAGGFRPYVRFGATADEQIADGVRFLVLKRGEQFTTPVAGQQISVLSGALMLAPEAVLTAESTRDRPSLLPAGGGRLTATADSLVAVADSEFLDLVASWDELARHARQTGGVVAERLAKLHHAVAFRRLPLECVEAALGRMTTREVCAGEEIVRQGDPGDAFYVIWDGCAEVWQTGPYDDEPMRVAVREVGDAFGEEALVTGGTRNATVRMTTDGVLLVLQQSDFLELMSHPLIEEVPPAVAKSMLDSGWIPVDVRYPEEFEDGHIPGALLLPLPELRQRCAEVLSADRKYVVVCLSGKRSAVGAMLLAQRGFRVAAMKNGMRDWEYAVESGSVA